MKTLKWTDKWGGRYEVSLNFATEILRQLSNESTPDGLENARRNRAALEAAYRVIVDLLKDTENARVVAKTLIRVKANEELKLLDNL